MAQLVVPRQGKLGVLRALDRTSADAVRELLLELPTDYPGADAWLDRRLSDVLDGAAECWMALVGSQLAGVTILTPKRSALKLSTIYVDPRYRVAASAGYL